MKRIGMGIVGAGFIGPHHVDAVRRLGYVDVVAVAGSNDASAQKKADALGIPKAYGSYEALLDDPDVQVVHNATPNYLHYPVNAAAIAKGKHVVSDKPLAMTAAEAQALLDQATKAGIVHAVTFNYRGNPLVQQARHAIARGDIGTPHFVHRPLPAGLAAQGHRLLVAARAGQGRRVVGARRHRLALVRPGAARQRPAHHARARRHHHGDPEAQEAEGRARGVRRRPAPTTAFELVDIKVEDLASVLLRFDNGAKGAFSVGQVCAGHKNDLRLEVCGSKASLRWQQEQQNELWIGHRDKANEILQKDPALLDAEVRGYAHLPGGHQEAWADAFCNLMRDIYGFIAAGKKPTDAHPPAFATFEDGYRANCIVEAILESAKKGSVWTQGEATEMADQKPFEPKFMKVGVLTAALQELTPREVRDPDPDRAIEDWLEFAQELGAELHPAVGGAASDRDRRAARGDARPGGQHARSAAAVRQGARARASQAAMKATGVGLSDVGYFDNLLHHDPAIRKKKHDFMLRVFDAAALLGVDAVCGFVGRNQQHSMDQNLRRLRGAVRPAAEGGEGRAG